MEPSPQGSASERGPELSDAALVEMYRGGGGEVAFGELIRRHQIALFRLLLGMLGDADEAERVCEQAFFEAARKLDELDDPAEFYGWVVRLARASVAKREEEQKRVRPKVPAPRAAPADPRGALKQEVQQVLSELTNDERVALVLADLEGDSFAAIGKTLGTSAAEAEAMVTRARSKFVDELATRAATAMEAPARPSAEMDHVKLGDVLGGRFRLEKRLGQGGMGAVFRARDLTRDKEVAVKTLLPEAAKDPALRRRFEREAEIIRRVEHPNFVRFIDFRQEPPEPAYVVMELLDGSALSKIIEEESRLDPARALHVIRHVLVGLRHAHSLGVIHRDVKPDNVILVAEDDDRDFAKILDLGIARLTGPEDLKKTRLTQKGELFGTPVYMSPEQVRGDEIDARADLYSATVMLYEMLASRPPFEAKNQMGLFALHLAGTPPPLNEVAPDLRAPEPLQALIDAGLSKEPSQRVASADEFLRRLDVLADCEWRAPAESRSVLAEKKGDPASARGAREASAREAPTEPRSRALERGASRARSGLIAILALALVTLVAWLLLGASAAP